MCCIGTLVHTVVKSGLVLILISAFVHFVLRVLSGEIFCLKKFVSVRFGLIKVDK